jgi:hypothetical protein
LKLALPLPDDADYQHLKQHIAQGGSIGAPFLDVKIPPEWDDGDFSRPAKVVGHEGRHRMKAALAVEGDDPVETHIFPKGGYRARDLTPEFIKHLNQSLETQAGGRVLSGPLFTVSVNENFTNYQGVRPPKNVPGTNLFPGQDIVGQRVYHCTNRLEAIKKSGGLKPRRDATGEREYGRLSTDEHPFIPVIGIWFSVGKPDWVGKHCVSFVIEPTDQVYVAYANTNGLKPNVVLNPIALDRLTVEGQQGVAEQGYGNHPSQRVDPRTGKKYVPPKSPLGQGVAENFADGKNPQDKGDAKRHGIDTKASVSSLRKTAKQGGRKGQLAHWLANMKAGRAKNNK